MSAPGKGRHKGQREERTPERLPSPSCPSPLHPMLLHPKSALAPGANHRLLPLLITAAAAYFWPFFFLASCFW